MSGRSKVVSICIALKQSGNSIRETYPHPSPDVHGPFRTAQNVVAKRRKRKSRLKGKTYLHGKIAVQQHQLPIPKLILKPLTVFRGDDVLLNPCKYSKLVSLLASLPLQVLLGLVAFFLILPLPRVLEDTGAFLDVTIPDVDC